MIAATLLLSLAAVAGHGGRALAGNAIDVNEQGPSGQPIIFWRTEQEDFNAVQALLDAGVDINTRGFRGATPAIWSAASNNWRMVKFLAERGADLSIEARDGLTVAKLAEISRVNPSSRDGRALEEVRGILRARGLY